MILKWRRSDDEVTTLITIKYKSKYDDMRMLHKRDYAERTIEDDFIVCSVIDPSSR